MNSRIRKLVNELGDAINHSLSNSEQVANVVARIKEEGFDLFLVLEATAGLRRHQEAEEPASLEIVGSGNRRNEPGLSVTASDLRFLKSLRISVDDAA
jgi:LytS/YehU family sensor histidine kinase